MYSGFVVIEQVSSAGKGYQSIFFRVPVPSFGVTSLPLLYSDAHLSRDFWICRQASFVFV